MQDPSSMDTLKIDFPVPMAIVSGGIRGFSPFSICRPCAVTDPDHLDLETDSRKLSP